MPLFEACGPDGSLSSGKQNITVSHKDFTCDLSLKHEHPVIRYLKNNVVIGRNGIIDLLTLETKEGFDFRFLFNRCIADLPNPNNGNNGYMLQAPIIDQATKDAPFYWVALSGHFSYGGDLFKNYLVHCDPKPAGAFFSPAYTARFFKLFAADKNLSQFLERGPGSNDVPLKFGAAIFKGGYNAPDAAKIMVTPCPIDADLPAQANMPVGHIYSFTKAVNAPNDNDALQRLHSFWYSVGMAARRMFDGTLAKDIDGNARSALFLNTHGSVPYLHFRLENDPSYYGQGSPLIDDQKSQTYYVKIFP